MIIIDDTKRFQRMKGFGASLTESSAWLIQYILTPPQRDELLRSLFSVEDGIGLSRLRQPIGACDFSLGSYSYDDTPGDIALKHFSLAREEKFSIPLLHHALKLNPALTIIASPWTAPRWMKTLPWWNGGQLRKDMFDVYANYLAKVVQSYRTHGIIIDALTLQNEPYFAPITYPGMRMTVAEQERLARCVSKVFTKEAMETPILVHDHNWNKTEEAIKLVAALHDVPQISGIAFHGYGGDISSQSRVHEMFPEVNIEITECSGGAWGRSFENNLLWDVGTLIIGGCRHWASTIMKWNLALNEQNGPTNGGPRTCHGVVTIHEETGEVTRNAEYYALGHVSKFVRPGAYCISSTNTVDTSIEHIAFQNDDKNVVIILLNREQSRQGIDVQWGGIKILAILPARSVATLVCRKGEAGGEMWLTTGDQEHLLEKSAIAMQTVV